jgi:hypothetical protein
MFQNLDTGQRPLPCKVIFSGRLHPGLSSCFPYPGMLEICKLNESGGQPLESPFSCFNKLPGRFGKRKMRVQSDSVPCLKTRKAVREQGGRPSI